VSSMPSIFVNSIKAGMKAACDEMFEFSGEQGRSLDCEYLLTVNVARKIHAGLSVTRGSPNRIFLEHRTRRFSSGCVPLFGKGKGGSASRSILRKIKNTTRNGKIDIAVYDNGPIEMPVCAIELKGFNPSKTSVLADLRRNLEYLRFEDLTGPNRLKYTFFAAMHSFPKTTSQAGCEKDIEGLKIRYERWIGALGALRDVKYDVATFTVESAFDVSAADDDETFFELEAHHFAGVIITFERKAP
jgi:hypothetical protein